MDIIKLGIIFLLIISIISFKRPLYIAIISGTLLTSVFYGIGPVELIRIIIGAFFNSTTISILLSFYTITFLQRMLDKRGHIQLAQDSLNGIFNNRRINVSIAPFFIGLLPSAGAIFISGDMVDAATGDLISEEDKTFLTTFYRHIPESFLPTYGSIILATEIVDIPVSSFIVSMIPIVIMLFFLGYMFYLRKIPKDTGHPPSKDKKQDIANLVKSLWTIALTIILILAFNLPVYIATLISIILSVIINKFKREELKPKFLSAFEPKLLIITVLVMIFKDTITHTGVINTLPSLFEKLPIPVPMVFAMIFFFGSIVSGQLAMVGLALPLAFVAMPDGGVPLMMLLMSFSYAAMQFSPTHICLTLVTEYFNTSMVDLLKRTAPIIGILSIFIGVYYIVLEMIL